MTIISMYLSEDVRKRIDAYASELGCSRNRALVRLITKALPKKSRGRPRVNQHYKPGTSALMIPKILGGKKNGTTSNRARSGLRRRV